jgi:hypothetical protein
MVVFFLKIFSTKILVTAKNKYFAENHRKQTTNVEYGCLTTLLNEHHVTTLSIYVYIDIMVEEEYLSKMMIYDMKG